MMYLVTPLLGYLALAFAFAAVAGWAWFGARAQPSIETASETRKRLIHDLVAISAETGGSGGVSPELQREMDSHRLRADMAQARATELERVAEGARARAETAVGRVAELERTLDQKQSDHEELGRLREQVAQHESEQSRVVEVEATPAPPSPAADDEAAAQRWRLRYFEQRVRYLEAQTVSAEAVVDENAVRQQDWRARFAEARVRHLEQELRTPAPVAAATESPPAPEPVAAAPELLEDPGQWRSRYLDKRLQHLRAQIEAAQSAPAAAPEADLSADLARWRTRYLESRVRHLETLAQAPVMETPKPVAEPPATAEPAPIAVPAEPVVQALATESTSTPPTAPAYTGPRERPPAQAAARDGAPDDFTLIDGVSHLQQSTLNALGIYHFEQIAAWTPANVAWVDQYLRLRGRITDQDWIGQASELAHSVVEPA